MAPVIFNVCSFSTVSVLPTIAYDMTRSYRFYSIIKHLLSFLFLQDDWEHREYIELVASGIQKMTSFLNLFDASCRSRLASLNEKLYSLERKIDYIEARIEKETKS